MISLFLLKSEILLNGIRLTGVQVVYEEYMIGNSLWCSEISLSGYDTVYLQVTTLYFGWDSELEAFVGQRARSSYVYVLP